MSISKDQVAHIARLARLELAPAETDSLTKDLGEILAYVDRIAALESEGGAGAADAAPDSTPGPTPLRDDQVLPSLAVADAVGASADHDDSYFRVPPVIEREEGA